MITAKHAGAALGVLGTGSVAAVGTKYALSSETKDENLASSPESQVKQIQIQPEEITKAIGSIKESGVTNEILSWSTKEGNCVMRIKFSKDEEAKQIMQLLSEDAHKTDLESLFAALTKEENEIKELCKKSHDNKKVLEATKLETNKWSFKEGGEIEESEKFPWTKDLPQTPTRTE